VRALSAEAKDDRGLLRASEQKDQPNEKGKYLKTGRLHTGAKPIEQQLGKTETQHHRSERRTGNRIHKQEPLAPRTWQTETEGFTQKIESRAKSETGRGGEDWCSDSRKTEARFGHTKSDTAPMSLCDAK
jgi:hypothetical protein